MSFYGSDMDLDTWLEENGYPDSQIDGQLVDVAAHALGDDVRLLLPHAQSYLPADVARQIGLALIRQADAADAGKDF